MNKNVRQDIVDKIIDILEHDPQSWTKTWSNLTQSTPYNPVSNASYYGINLINLALDQSRLLKTLDPRWCTFKQANISGYKVKKGSSCSYVLYFDKQNQLIKDNIIVLSLNSNDRESQIQKILDFYSYEHPRSINAIGSLNISNDKEIRDIVSDLNNVTGTNLSYKTGYITKSYPVFNFSQLETVPELFTTKRQKPEIHTEAQHILDKSGAKLFHDQIDRNYYSPLDHEIHLTLPESFKTRDDYYSVALHELAHWTKGEGIIRNYDHKRGNIDDYAREELRAELSSVFTSRELGLKLDLQNHKAYLASYARILKKDPSELFLAISDANKISDHIMTYSLIKDKTSDIKASNDTVQKEIILPNHKVIKSKGVDNEQSLEL